MVVDFQAGARAITVGGSLPSLTADEGLFPLLKQARAMAFPARMDQESLSLDSPLKVMTYSQKSFEDLNRNVEPNVKKIAILRSNGIGDYIFVLPALSALRLAYPDAEIVLLGLNWHKEFLENRPGPIDRVIVVPRSRGVREPSDFTEENPAELDSFFEEMAREKFDIAIQMHGGGRYSNPFVKRLGARLTVGFRTPDAEPLDRWVPYIYFQSEVMRYLEAASLVGARLASLEPHIVVTDRDLAESREIVPETNKPLVVLHPGAGDPRRRWPVEKFAAIGNALAWAGAHVTVVGIEEDRGLVDGVVNSMSADAQNLCGRLSLGGLTGLLARARVVVSNDSGPLHLAVAVGTPTVGIYWCGNMINAGPVTRSRHRPAISWRLDCPICGLNCTRNACDHAVSFVADVSQEEITTLALELANFEQQVERAPILAVL